MPKQEEFHNRILAQLLTEHGVAADYEERRGRRKLDVVAEVDGLEVVLEAETGFDHKAQAIKDADARLKAKARRRRVRRLLSRRRHRGQPARRHIGLDCPDKAGGTVQRVVRRAAWRSWPRPSSKRRTPSAAPTLPRGCSPTAWIKWCRSSSRPCGRRWRGILTFPRRAPRASRRAKGTSWPPSAACSWWQPPCCFITGFKITCRRPVPA